MRRGTGCLFAVLVSSIAFGGCWTCVADMTAMLLPRKKVCPCGEPLGQPAKPKDDEPARLPAGLLSPTSRLDRSLRVKPSKAERFRLRTGPRPSRLRAG